MSIGTFAELKTALETFLERASDSTITANAADFVKLAESEMNADLKGLRRTTINGTPLTGTPASRQLTLPASFLSPVSLHLTTFGTQEPMRAIIIGSQPLSTTSGTPQAWGINDDAIDLDRPCDQAHTFLLRYHKKLDIASDSTNWLLSNYPNAYLYGSLKHAAVLLQDYNAAQGYGTLYEDIIRKIRNAELANLSRATLTVDPALLVASVRGASVAGFANGD